MNISKKETIAILTLVKNEALYLKEFIDYYLFIGVDCIFIYDDESSDNILETLQPYIDLSKVKYVRIKRRDNSGKFINRWGHYKDFYKNYANKFDWLINCDVDEFLCFSKKTSLVCLQTLIDKLNKFGILCLAIYCREFVPIKNEILNESSIRQFIKQVSLPSIINSGEVKYLVKIKSINMNENIYTNHNIPLKKNYEVFTSDYKKTDFEITTCAIPEKTKFKKYKIHIDECELQFNHYRFRNFNNKIQNYKHNTWNKFYRLKTLNNYLNKTCAVNNALKNIMFYCEINKVANNISNQPKIAIVIPFNDLKYVTGTTRGGIKGSLTYLEQFYMLYYSIKDNWKFNYDIYIVHSCDFDTDVLEKLKKLDVKILKITTTNLLIRPESYLLNIDCDYRLVLDCDMVALNNPSFNFNYNAQAMYGDFNYELLPKSIFKNLRMRIPNENNYEKYQKIESGNDPFSKTNFDLINKFYDNKDHSKKFYPIFNHGAILINNKYTKIIGKKLLKYKVLYNSFNGQNVIGYIINDSTNENWHHFDKGFNFTLNENRLQENKKKYLDDGGRIELLHYINVSKESKYFTKYIKKYYDLVKSM